jgi:ADP-L-glycero-D-manno-heptose 6-epimerase
MMVVTGAVGFIGSCMIKALNEAGFNYIIAVDDFSDAEKNKNLEGKIIQEKVDRKDFFLWLDKNQQHTEFIIHIGARTDTTEFDTVIFGEVFQRNMETLHRLSNSFDLCFFCRNLWQWRIRIQ